MAMWNVDPPDLLLYSVELFISPVPWSQHTCISWGVLRPTVVTPTEDSWRKWETRRASSVGNWEAGKFNHSDGDSGNNRSMGCWEWENAFLVLDKDHIYINKMPM